MIHTSHMRTQERLNHQALNPFDQDIVLEDWAEMIQLDEQNELKQVRFSPRLDFVPLMDKKKLEIYYSARKKISSSSYSLESIL